MFIANYCNYNSICSMRGQQSRARDEAIEYHEIPEIDNVNQNAYNV